MESPRSLSLYQKLTACTIIIVGCVLQWVLVGGSNPLHLFSFGHQSISMKTEIHKLVLHKAKFQLGMVFPRWGYEAYGPQDADWVKGLYDIYQQTHAQWIEITVNLYQAAPSSTMVVVKPTMAPSLTALSAGIHMARALGYQVFVVPLLTVGETAPKSGWSGSINFPSFKQEQEWFDSYWEALAPFVRAADQAGAEQFAIGNEDALLEKAPAILWDQLITRFLNNFRGKLSYNMNWSSLTIPLPVWMLNPNLATVGVSVYNPLASSPIPLDPTTLPKIWREKIDTELDALSFHLSKPVLISEIGYRDTADALYEPWMRTTSAPLDPDEQAAAYNAALTNVIGDPHIAGIFFWAWSFPLFLPNGQPAAAVLDKWYTSPLVQ